ncbi:serine hydrolase domain-containing protein [Sinomicrobium weinanense]|uniref:Serine hydrolase n=1 Tax=Sinomicrobium weinanense TaxID=2842200 RepID=A0A926JPH8_9FLAO|nr:serine hydrolase [Sinomicrobium weinanense]MBC9795092.1 serine hydrolase [Sinomicrobium weinanense]MBU3123777.1 beta-lactamase family protein [Sinomicrobium weinanense]
MTIQRNKVINLGLFFLLILVGACKQKRIESIPAFTWKTESPEKLGLDKNVLNKFIADIKDSTLYGVDALVVVKNGKIAFEEYFNGSTADSLHDVTSVGKSITSALVGIAIEKRYITGKNEPVTGYFKDYKIKEQSPEKEKIRIRHLLTMTAGWACDDWDAGSPGNTMHFPDVPDDFAFTLNLPMIRANGEVFSYCSGGANLLGEIIRRRSGVSLKGFADKYLFHNIGIMKNEWFVVPKPPHYEFAGGGNVLRPRDLARFGLLYLNKGEWQGKQIIPKDWIRESTSKQIETNEDGDYGYLWWIKDYRYKNKTVKGFEASGNGGNKIVVIPELDIVMILTGSAYGSEYVEGEQARKIIEDYVIASIK